MIKVFLVEDELIIRNGIKNSISWRDNGFELVGEASDGELAFPLIKKEHPDVLITDIKMPFMDGLELSKLIRKELPEIKIVILSGYNDFSYAKEAISIGVTEYLLKPISADKLMESLKRIAEIVRTEREQKSVLQDYEQENQENIEFAKVNLFNNIMAGRLSLVDILEEGGRFSKNFGAGAYNILLIKIYNKNRGLEYTNQIVEASEEIEKISADRIDVFCCRRGIEGWGYLLMADNEEDVVRLTTELKKKLYTVMQGYPSLSFFGGSGEPVTRISALGHSYTNADQAFAQRFIREESQIMGSKEVEEKEKQERIDLHSLGSMENNRAMVRKFLNNGTMEELDSFIDVFFREISEDILNSMMMRQYLIMDVYAIIVSFMDKIDGEHEPMNLKLEEVKSKIQLIQSPQETRECVKEIIRTMVDYRDTVSGRRFSDVIMQAKEYIHNNYMSDEMSLNHVASEVNMSPSYFSSIFGKEVGKTFVEYLTEERMERAKDLLMCSSMKSSEIAFEVGYKDPHYFSYTFKKTQNCTPKEYRSRRKQ